MMKLMVALTGLSLSLNAPMLVSVAHAQEYPSRGPISIVVPFPPGTTPDVVDRAVAEKMSLQLKQKILVENRPGAGGAVGTAYAAKAKPDGYTLLGYGGSALTSAFVKDLPFDLLRDLAPVGQIYQGYMLLLGSTASKAKSVPEVVAQAKAAPGKLTLGSATTLTTVAAMVFQRELGVEMAVISYKGSTEVATALARGEIDAAATGSDPVTRSQVQAGRIRGLMVMGPTKSRMIPDMPTSSELGYPRIKASATGGIWAPAGTPKEVIARLNAALNSALKEPDVQETIRLVGYEATPTTPDEYRKSIEVESQFWAEAAKRAGVKPQ